jgi:dTDP-4-dehydrorhamnose 3,5-epimerase
MIFAATALQGAYLVDLERVEDERGFFARWYCEDEFAARGIGERMRQCSLSHNLRAGTLRGMHYQAEPHGEAKLVRCTSGAIFDAIIDIRPGSPTRLGWFALELTAANRRSLYVPTGFAHGFVTLTDDAEVSYMISTPYAPGAGRGIRWNDPAVGIEWPVTPTVVSARDAAYPLIEAGRG